jgi:hypothetical protein
VPSSFVPEISLELHKGSEYRSFLDFEIFNFYRNYILLGLTSYYKAGLLGYLVLLCLGPPEPVWPFKPRLVNMNKGFGIFPLATAPVPA